MSCSFLTQNSPMHSGHLTRLHQTRISVFVFFPHCNFHIKPLILFVYLSFQNGVNPKSLLSLYCPIHKNSISYNPLCVLTTSKSALSTSNSSPSPCSTNWLTIISAQLVTYKSHPSGNRTYNNNNVHLSCAHQGPERSHDTY